MARILPRAAVPDGGAKGAETRRERDAGTAPDIDFPRQSC